MPIYMGRCFKCRVVSRMTAEATGGHRDITGNGYMRPVLRLEDGAEVAPLSVDEFAVQCSCGASVVHRRVVGKHDPHKVCDRRCRRAYSSSCECSCNGANHGADYSAGLRQ